LGDSKVKKIPFSAREKSHSKGQEESLLLEGLFLKSNFLSLKERPSRSKPSLLKEKKDN